MVARVGDRVSKPVTKGEPHIGSTISDDPKPAVELTGYVRGGTTNPPKGQSGDIERFDAAGKSVKEGSAKAQATKSASNVEEAKAAEAVKS